jgi:hypothetical protein
MNPAWIHRTSYKKEYNMKNKVCQTIKGVSVNDRFFL